MSAYRLKCMCIFLGLTQQISRKKVPQDVQWRRFKTTTQQFAFLVRDKDTSNVCTAADGMDGHFIRTVAVTAQADAVLLTVSFRHTRHKLTLVARKTDSCHTHSHHNTKSRIFQ